MVNKPAGDTGIIFDSTKMQNTGAPKKKGGLPKFYYPLVITILLAEAVALGFILFNLFPLGKTLEIYPYAQYGQYVSSTDVTQLSVTITRWFFFLLTAGVLIPTTLLIIMEITRRVLIARKVEVNSWDDEFKWLDKIDKAPKAAPDAASKVEGEYIKRFDVHQRIQHYFLMGSFIILAVTGMLRGFPDWPTFSWFASILGGMDALRLVHDIAAFIMIADGIYHLVYIFYAWIGKHKAPSAMFPRWKDLKDIIHTMFWIVGIYKNEPEYDHFQYGQKIDYWAIFWGMPVMVITGIIMMFSTYFSQYIGGQWFAVLATAHRDEAVLATGFILIVHMYYGHLAASTFPMNTVMFTGKMPKAKYKEWFGREYKQITGDKD